MDLFFGEKETLEESNEHSLNKLRRPGIFFYVRSSKQLYMLFVAQSPIELRQSQYSPRYYTSLQDPRLQGFVRVSKNHLTLKNPGILVT